MKATESKSSDTQHTPDTDSSAKVILRMIETVSPDDAAKLDEIDARVWCYVTEQEFMASDGMGFVINDRNHAKHFKWKEWNDDGAWTESRRYSTSRDALKSIRPEGWFPLMGGWPQDTPQTYEFCLDNGKKRVTSPQCLLITEELAELHAIIQAIDYERSKG